MIHSSTPYEDREMRSSYACIPLCYDEACCKGDPLNRVGAVDSCKYHAFTSAGWAHCKAYVALLSDAIAMSKEQGVLILRTMTDSTQMGTCTLAHQAMQSQRSR